jgi:hypothetical protein
MTIEGGFIYVRRAYMPHVIGHVADAVAKERCRYSFSSPLSSGTTRKRASRLVTPSLLVCSYYTRRDRGQYHQPSTKIWTVPHLRAREPFALSFPTRWIPTSRYSRWPQRIPTGYSIGQDRSKSTKCVFDSTNYASIVNETLPRERRQNACARPAPKRRQITPGSQRHPYVPLTTNALLADPARIVVKEIVCEKIAHFLVVVVFAVEVTWEVD